MNLLFDTIFAIQAKKNLGNQEAATGDVLYSKECSWIFSKIHKKTPVPEPLCYKNYSPETWNFIKKETLAEVLSYEFCEYFKSTFL